MRYLAVILLFVLFQTVSAQDEAAFSWQCPGDYAGQELNIYNWTTYIHEDVVPYFERVCDVNINYDTYDTDTTMYEQIKLGNPGYDLVVPTGYVLQQMIEEGLIIPIDHDLIPNFANINPRFLGLQSDPENEFSIPYQWSTIVVGYKTSAFPDGISSWEEVWDYDGSVAWLDDARVMLGIALNQLGYDPNSTNAAEILEARDYLGERAGNVTHFVADPDGQDMLARGDVDVVVEWSGDLLSVIDACDCNDFSVAIPVEGSLTIISNWAIPVDAANPELAMVFMDYLASPEVAAANSNYTHYATVNQAAIAADLIEPEIFSNPVIYPNAIVQENLFFLQYLNDDASTAYDVAWEELRTFFRD